MFKVLEVIKTKHEHLSTINLTEVCHKLDMNVLSENYSLAIQQNRSRTKRCSS